MAEAAGSSNRLFSQSNNRTKVYPPPPVPDPLPRRFLPLASGWKRPSFYVPAAPRARLPDENKGSPELGSLPSYRGAGPGTAVLSLWRSKESPEGFRPPKTVVPGQGSPSSPHPQALGLAGDAAPRQRSARNRTQSPPAPAGAREKEDSSSGSGCLNASGARLFFFGLHFENCSPGWGSMGSGG